MTGVAVVGHLRRLVTTAEADEVGGDDAQARCGEERDHLAVQVAPRRLTVHAQNRSPIGRALVEVVDPQSAAVEVIDLDVVWGKRITGKVNESFVRRA